MAGGLMQLIAVGAQDQYMTASPEFSYFRAVIKRHSNFAMESVRQTFLTKPVLEASTTSYTCRIGRIADLLGEVYLSFQLPDIYSDDKFRFQWIPNLAYHMIESYSVRVDTQLIDQGYGEWLDVWNELSMQPGKRYAHDRMIGNVEEFTSPKSLDIRVIVENNSVRYSYYPEGTADTPSIQGRRFFVPLPFWFSRNPSLALPLVALQYQVVEITIEFKSIESLYQLYDERTDKYISPNAYRERYGSTTPGLNVSISNFTRFGGNGPSSVDLDAYLECNFIFLDEAERRTIASKSMDFLIERVYRSRHDGIRGQGTLDLVFSNPVKEIVWFTRRADVRTYNSWSNFTATIPENHVAPILSTAKFLWNGLERLEEKPSTYFNLIQPYQHHTASPREGVYAYSFAIFPEKHQPSGSFNASMVNKVQMYVTTTDPSNEYEMVVFGLYYNIFRVMGGRGDMVFAN